MLSWLAQCRHGDPVVKVFHGKGVELADQWFCEAAWDGDFNSGDFDQTDIVAGSGARVRGSAVIFVSAGSTLDRLQSLATDDGMWISNSLSCLVSASGAQIDESSGKYFWLFRTIVGGMKRYRRLFPTSKGPITLTYFDNLVWEDDALTVRAKPGLGRDFSSFDAYHRFLQDSMQGLAANARAKERRHPYDLLTTASSGYDSATVTVLAKQAGANQVLCFDQARRGLDDSGEPLARQLGLNATVVERQAWRDKPLPEVPFLASDSHGGDVFFRGAEGTLANKLLLTGYHGDKIWAKSVHTPVNEHIVRGDQSGLSLTEYRLKTGTLHCSIGFWGVRQITDIHAISNSAEMAPWDVPGDYSRPICRRIVESAGVPREMFGIEKKATWVLMLHSREFLSPSSLEHYLQWLKARRAVWVKHGRLPPTSSEQLDNAEIAVRRAAGKLGALEPTSWYIKALHKSGLIRGVWRLGEGPTYLRRYTFAWALDQHRQAYPPIR